MARLGTAGRLVGRGVGAGYGTVAIKDDRIFVQGSAGGRSVVYSAEPRRRQGPLVEGARAGAASNDRGSGPRGTPTVDGDRVYVLTENGDLACLKAQDGTAVWQRNILKDFGGRNINWLISESPLVDGNHVIVTPGRARRRHGGARQDDRQRPSGPARS